MDAYRAGSVPYRHLARLRSAFHLSSLDCLHRFGIDDVTRAAVFQAVARACVGDWIVDGCIRPPIAPDAGTTVQSLSASLGLAPETTRRHVLGLVADGSCIRRGRRLMLGVASMAGGPVADYLMETHDVLLQLVRGVADYGLELPARREGAAHPWAGVLRTALDLNLEPVENFRGVGWDLNTMALWMAVSALEVAHVTNDPVLSRAYGIAYTPDHLRRPVSLRTAARRLSVPYATAWRRADELRRLGMMRPVPGGWLIARAELEDERVSGAMEVQADRMLRRIRSLVIEGLDTTRIGDVASTSGRTAPDGGSRSPRGDDASTRITPDRRRRGSRKRVDPGGRSLAHTRVGPRLPASEPSTSAS